MSGADHRPVGVRGELPWTTLFIEGVAIVVSILLAFAIDAWWDQRKDRAEERDILIGLEMEFIDLRERLESWAVFNQDGFGMLDRFLSDSVSDMDSSEFEQVFIRSFLVNVLDQGGPLDALLASGRLEKIRDDEIRARLAKWPDWLEDIHTNDLSIRDFAWREIGPALAKHGIPVIFYFSGVHEDYHGPGDTPDKIRYPKMSEIGRLVFLTSWEVANRDDKLAVDRVNDFPSNR